MTGAWQGDWRERVMGRLYASQLTTVTDLCKRHPGMPFMELAERLGNDVVAAQVFDLLRSENPSARWFMRDSLARCLNAFMPLGWDPSEAANFTRIRAYTDWLGVLGRAHKQNADAAWSRLEDARPEKGWRPAGPDDQLLLRVIPDDTEK